MRRADRLFQIIQYLRSRRVTTAKWLAEALEVSERTIYRDIQDLAASGTPIEGEAGVGYVLRKGYNLPPLMFNKDEIAALTLGARLVKSWADPKLASAAEQVLSKVETVLPNHRKTDLHEARLFAPLTLIPPAVSTTMGCIRPAIDSQNKLRFNLHSSGWRAFQPHRLASGPVFLGFRLDARSLVRITQLVSYFSP